MARKRKELGAEGERRLVELARAGGTAEGIAASLRAMGLTVSRSTVGARMAELKGKVKGGRRAMPRGGAAKASGEEPPLPPSPDAIPEGADPGTIDRWIKRAEELAEIASNAGEVDGFVKMGRLSTALLEHKRKATPPPAPDPNESPDMVALAADVARRLHTMIDQATS